MPIRSRRTLPATTRMLSAIIHLSCQRGGRRRAASSGKGVKGLLHAPVGGGRSLLRADAVLTRAQVGGVPVPPVVLGVRLLVAAVAFRRLSEQLSQGRDVRGRWRHLIPLAAGETRADLLEQPPVPVRV